MSECIECGANDWTFWGCSYGDNEYVVEACRGCTRVKPDGFILQLTDDIRDELKAEAELNIGVVLKTLEDKVARIDEVVLEIRDMLNGIIEAVKDNKGEEAE